MSDLPILTLKIVPDSPDSLFDQVYDLLRQRIISGGLQAGDKLPPSRKLAEDNGLSRTTILSAYDQLTAEGYVEGRAGSGIYVCDLGDNRPILATAPKPVLSIRRGDNRPLPFTPGAGDERLFPGKQWAKYVTRIARQSPLALVHQDHAFGNIDLRAAICRYLAEWRGFAPEPDQVVITAGAGDGLDIILRSMMTRGDAIALENPGYQSIAHFAGDLGLNRIWMNQDDAGSIPPTKGAKLAMITPSSQFPLGGAMPMARRNAFLSWAEKHDGYVIEDDYDSEFRYAGRPLPALAGLDHLDRVIYVGSFTKVFNTGIRLGYAVLPKALIPSFYQGLRRYGVRASVMPQQPLAAFMDDGPYYRHIRKSRRIYGERRQALVQLLQNLPVDITDFTDFRAGMHIALHLADHIPDKIVSTRAAELGLGCLPLSANYQTKIKGNGLLLGYCSHSDSEISTAFPVLTEILTKIHQQT